MADNHSTFKIQHFQMAYYHKLGNIPHKRHTQFRKPDGTSYIQNNYFQQKVFQMIILCCIILIRQHKS